MSTEISTQPLVNFDNVALRYGNGAESILALEGLNLSIQSGEFVAVVGMSGCGKSSLLKLMSGLVRPTTGSVTIHGQEVTKPLGIVGMAFQNPSLMPWRRALENVILPLEIKSEQRWLHSGNAREHKEKARELLSKVGLSGFEDKYPKELSGGMKQRVSLCRALIHQPELLLLDEPFGALDAFTREELWGVLQRLHKETGCTVVLITHDLTESVYLADTVHVMSPRPGHLVYGAEVPFERPRDLDDRFKVSFTQIVADLRHHISKGPEAEAV